MTVARAETVKPVEWPARKKWTNEEICALGARTDLLTACSIAFGIGKTKAYEMYRAGELHFPMIKVGRRVVVPVAPLLEYLGMSKTDASRLVGKALTR